MRIACAASSALLLSLTACGGARSTETTVVTVTNVQTVTIAAPPPKRDYTHFQMPSKNIGCGVDEAAGVLRCDILSGLVPEPSGSCELDWAGFVLERGGPAEPVCAGDTIYDAASPVLAYGESWGRGGINCDSREEGLRCVNRDDHGFSLARASSRAF